MTTALINGLISILTDKDVKENINKLEPYVLFSEPSPAGPRTRGRHARRRIHTPEDVEDEEAGEVERETAASSATGPDPSGKGK